MSQRTPHADGRTATFDAAHDGAGRSRERPEPPVLLATRNSLPAATRRQVVPLLNQRLADAIDLECQCRQAHWNVRGAGFIALHRLFDEVHEAVDGYIDTLAERVVQLGGTAEGSVGVVAQRTTLPEYPLVLHAGGDHVEALATGLGAFARSLRIGIEEMNELQDADSADILTELSRGVDKWLWFVEAHLPARMESPDA